MDHFSCISLQMSKRFKVFRALRDLFVALREPFISVKGLIFLLKSPSNVSNLYGCQNLVRSPFQHHWHIRTMASRIASSSLSNTFWGFNSFQRHYFTSDCNPSAGFKLMPTKCFSFLLFCVKMTASNFYSLTVLMWTLFTRWWMHLNSLNILIFFFFPNWDGFCCWETQKQAIKIWRVQ